MLTNSDSFRAFFKRHSELFLIIAFVLVDWIISGWALAIGTMIAIATVAGPMARTISARTPSDRHIYLKALLKTRKVQRLALLLFSVYTCRVILEALQYVDFDLNYGHTSLPPVQGTLPASGATFAFLLYPILIYVAACFLAICLRSRLKATKQDPDLVTQRQRWVGVTQILLFGAFVAAILSITLHPIGPGYMLSNSLLAAARDANLLGGISTLLTENFFIVLPTIGRGNVAGVTYNDSFYAWFDTFVLTSFSLALFLTLSPGALRLNSFLTSFCWRVVSPRSVQNIVEGFIEAIRLPARHLVLKKAHPLVSNAVRTLVWLILCYLGLFWLFGFCGGPLGFAIQSWMIASAVDAGIASANAAPKWLFGSDWRIFVGSIVALYGTAPLAVTACVVLPCVRARQIKINSDGMLFSQGPFLCLWGRQFRLWTDLESISVKTNGAPNTVPNAKKKYQFTFKFRTGGRLKFNQNQVSGQDLRVLLDAEDQHAINCRVDEEVIAACRTLEQLDKKTASDCVVDSALKALPAQEFKSTIFVPFSQGDFLPGTQIRIIRQLASKPLCAVYLARNENGKMLIAKQFYLAEETEETKAFSKILQREYELLSRLDHPGIAKVIDSFRIDNSTFLLIEQRPGNDLRSTVTEHGPRSESLTINWAQQLCEIMIYLHNREPAVLHRDLTPDNVIAGEDGLLRLIDFGAAREFLEGITGTMIGKQCYVPPEQLRGDARKTSDIYSFGCTMHYLLTGRDPVALSQSSPAKITDCSDELDRLIRECTSLEEEDRPQSFEEILERLKSINCGFRLKLSSSKSVAAA